MDQNSSWINISRLCIREILNSVNTIFCRNSAIVEGLGRYSKICDHSVHWKALPIRSDAPFFWKWGRPLTSWPGFPHNFVFILYYLYSLFSEFILTNHRKSTEGLWRGQGRELMSCIFVRLGKWTLAWKIRVRFSVLDSVVMRDGAEGWGAGVFAWRITRLAVLDDGCDGGWGRGLSSLGIKDEVIGVNNPFGMFHTLDSLHLDVAKINRLFSLIQHDVQVR